MSSIQDLLEFKYDFEGQKLAEQISKSILVSATVISFVLGFVSQSLTVTFGTFGASTLLVALIAAPPWPMFNKNPVKWLPAVETKKIE